MGFEWLTHKPYKRHYICLDCQKGFKRSSKEDIVSEEAKEDYHPTCPQCQKEMIQVAYTFEVPKQNDKKAWKELEKRYNP